MRRIGIWLLAVLTALSLCACGKAEVYDVFMEGGTFTVDTVNETVTFNEDVIEYDLKGRSDGSSVTFTYPDGSTYYWTNSGYMGYGGWSDDYDENRYVSGDILRDVLEEEADAVRKSGNMGEDFGLFLVGLAAVGVGAFNLWAPERAWYLRRGWMFKDAQPSDTALAVTRVSGLVCIAAGIAAMLYLFLA